jgi:hypothetical protein
MRNSAVQRMLVPSSQRNGDDSSQRNGVERQIEFTHDIEVLVSITEYISDLKVRNMCTLKVLGCKWDAIAKTRAHILVLKSKCCQMLSSAV